MAWYLHYKYRKTDCVVAVRGRNRGLDLFQSNRDPESSRTQIIATCNCASRQSH